MQKDPHPGKLSLPGTIANKYAYVLNNAINWTDPDGEIIWFLLIPLIMTVAGAVSGAIWAGATGQDLLSGIALGALGGLLSGVGAVTGLFVAAAAIGIPTGMSLVTAGGALIGSTLGTVASGIGAGVAGAIWGGIHGGELGALAGFVFGFAGGAITGGGILPKWVDLGTNTIVSAPPVSGPTSVLPKIQPTVTPTPIP